MVKKRVTAWLAGLAILFAVAGSSADIIGSLVSAVTPDQTQAIACNDPNGSGGGC